MWHVRVLGLLFLLSPSFLIAAETLTINNTDSARYGYRYSGVETNRVRADFTFQGASNDLLLDLTGYDIDTPDEVSVRVNGRLLGHLKRTSSYRSGASSISIPASAQVAGDNSLAFVQKSPGWRWGISNLLLTNVTPRLQTGVFEPRIFGYNYRHVIANRRSARFTFLGGSDRLKLEVDGYDIDTNTEVAVLVNDRNIGYLKRTADNSTGPSSFIIPIDRQKDGLNVLSFKQRRLGLTWGVTDLLLDVDVIEQATVPPAVPSQVLPVANSLLEHDSLVFFKWRTSSRATDYRVEIIDTQNAQLQTPGFTVSEKHCADSKCQASIALDLPTGRNYQWRVRAENSAGKSAWSTTDIGITDPGAQDSLVVLDTDVSGGGFQGDVSVTDDGLTVYSSADNSGVFKSSDGGLLFENINEGLESTKVASLAITPDNERILYAGTGDKGLNSFGGLFRSVNAGETWVKTAIIDRENNLTNAVFAGNHPGSNALPEAHPRSNGDLIVVDTGDNASAYLDDIVIAGTYNRGVRLYNRGGDNEVSAVRTSGFVRSLAGNPDVPDIVYAAIQFSQRNQNGIYRIDYSNISNPVSTLVYQTLRPEGVTVLSNGHVYAAIGKKGIVKYDGRSWAQHNTGLSINNENRQWTAVTGYVANNEDVVYAGTTNLGGTQSGADYSTIWRSINGGESWSALVNAEINVSDTVYGQSHDWWYRVDAFREAGLGRKNSVVSSIDVALGRLKQRVSDDIIYVSGRGGIWKSDDGGDSWKPAVNNMQATENTGVIVNPNDPSQVVLANTDYLVLHTRTGFEGGDVARDKPDDSESRAYDAIFDARSNEIILATGDRDTNAKGGGEVFVKSADALDAPAGRGWKDTELSSATKSNNGRARALTYGYHNGRVSTTQTILTVVEGEGVFRYHNGKWSKSTGINLAGSLTERSEFVWPANEYSGDVYLLDLSAGLFRSKDGGQSWTNIWPSMTFRNNDFFSTGYIVADKSDPTTLYVSIVGDRGSPIGNRFKVYRMRGANTGIFGIPGSAGIDDITMDSSGGSIERPGPLNLGPDGILWLAGQQSSNISVDAALYVMENPQSDTTFTDISTQEYRNVAVSPTGIEVSSDGSMYISQDGGGVVKLAIPCRYNGNCTSR